MVRRTKEQALETRGLLLDAAEQLFHAQGVSRTSLDQIAKAAGLTRGAVYWHFSGKADLFSAMLERTVHPIEQAVQRATAGEVDDPVAHLHAIVMEVLRLTVADTRIRRVFEIATLKVEMTGDLHEARSRRLLAREAFVSHYERGLALARDRGLISSEAPPRNLAWGLFSMLDGLILNWLLAQGGFDLQAVGAEVIGTYWKGLGHTLPAANVS